MQDVKEIFEMCPFFLSHKISTTDTRNGFFFSFSCLVLKPNTQEQGLVPTAVKTIFTVLVEKLFAGPEVLLGAEAL